MVSADDAEAPKDELMILLECAEDAFPMGRAADFSGRPSGQDRRLVTRCERQGWVRLDEVRHAPDGRIVMRPRLTPDGHRRIAELNQSGVQPSRAMDADDHD